LLAGFNHGSEKIVPEFPVLKTVAHFTMTTLVDNYTDVLLEDGMFVKRCSRVRKDGKRRAPLLAEHGLSLLFEIEGDSERHSVMMDFGLSNIAVPNNISALEIGLDDVETFIISHGHHDHIGSLKEVLTAIPGPKEVIVHPDAFIEERLAVLDDGSHVPIPSLRRESLEPLGCPIVEIMSPRILANGHMATITNIPRVTDFEKGMPNAYYKAGNALYKDAIWDDQGIVVHVKGKGLVIVTGCGHSGIINTILHAQEIAGVKDIFAVIGGFHLSGSFFEPIIIPTIEEMKKFSPAVLVPTHCTGWKAMVAFEREFPDAFILNSVGAKIVI
jgi:7,8-dihydropterin-6-yl-methyl-4-(beta-D-ribofuranosyl)aminobenzene 5'-phosphate synthase